MNEFTQHMISKGWVKLQLGSYRVWMRKKWHEMFVCRGLVRKNFYQQFVPNTLTLSEFSRWLSLYDKTQHDHEFPKSKPFLTPDEITEIRQIII